MGVDWMQKRVSSQATRVACRIVWPAIATAGVAELGIVDAKLRVVEQIESSARNSRLLPSVFLKCLRTVVKVQATEVVHEIPPRIAESQSLGSHKGGRIVNVGPILCGLLLLFQAST
jgi:hypothetical protein